MKKRKEKNHRGWQKRRQRKKEDIIVGKRRAFERRRAWRRERPPLMISNGPKTKEKTHREREKKHHHRDRRRRRRIQTPPNIYIYIYIYIHDARTVGPAFATINTVSPLGTALTVPRSHPVTGILFCCCTKVFAFFFSTNVCGQTNTSYAKKTPTKKKKKRL